jgi:hypothetical protein
VKSISIGLYPFNGASGVSAELLWHVGSEMIEQLEPRTTELGQRPGDCDDGSKTINAIFRFFHLLIGRAGGFCLDTIRM